MSEAMQALLSALQQGATVLTPTGETAAALFDSIERLYRARGDEVWPTPKIREFRGWVRERYENHRLENAHLPRTLNDVEARELWRRAVAHSDASSDFIDPSGAARGARLAWRTLHDYEIPRGALAAYPGAETLALTAWMDDFQAQCRTLAVVDAESLPPPLAMQEPLLWIDSPAWWPAARAFLARHGVRRLDAEVRPAPTPAFVSRVLADSPDEELAAAAQWARQRAQQRDGFRAWIYLPNLSQQRLAAARAFDAALAPQRYGLPGREPDPLYAIAGGTPLADFSPVSAALAVLSASLAPLPFERFSALLRLPQLHNSDNDASAAVAIDVALRDRAPGDADLAAWLGLATGIAQTAGLQPVCALDRLIAVTTHLDRLRGAHALSDWVPVWMAALQSGPWANSGAWSSREYQAAGRLRELFDALAGADQVFGTLTRSQSFSLLEEAARQTAFQPQTGIPPVWITGQAADPWIAYDGLWVLGANAQQWPAPAAPVPLLPQRLQREYAVHGSSPQLQLQFARDLQARWLKRASELRLSISGDHRGLPAWSPLLAQSVPAEPAAAPVDPHWRAQRAESLTFEFRSDESGPPFAAGEATHGHRSLQAQSLCAFRGFAESRLAADDLPLPTPGFNRKDRGILLHEAVRNIWMKLNSSQRLADLSVQQRILLIESAVEAALLHPRYRYPGTVWLARERQRMSGLLQTWLDVELQRAAFEVQSLERAGIARHGGLDFNIRIDRVDRLADGACVIIDYKSGLAHKDWRDERPDNPQLPLYAVAIGLPLAAVAYAQIRARECKFVAEADRPGIFSPADKPSQLEGAADLPALMQIWARRLDSIATQLRVGAAEVAPKARACENCHLHGLCRIADADGA